MELSVDSLLKVMAAMLMVCPVSSEDEEGKKLKECSGNRHVCTTLMKYPDGYVANEGPYCTCNNGDCGSAWSDDDRALTWKHYERVHWKVQYRFCSPVPKDTLPLCDPGELAAVVETEVESWGPYLEEARCKCRDGTLHMTGWRKQDNVWKYFYACDKRECSPGDACASIYVDTNRKSDIVKEVVFKCACPQGDMCPAKIKDESAVKESEVLMRCESIKQATKKKEK